MINKMVVIILAVVLLVVSSCSSENQNNTTEESVESDIYSVSQENLAEEIDVNDKLRLIENIENISWDDNEFVVDSIRNIFILRERFYNQEYDYTHLSDSLGQYFDLPMTFVKPDSIYGFEDPSDDSTAVLNKDITGLSTDEFADLIEEITLFVKPSDILQINIDGSGGIGTITPKDKKFFLSSVIEEDDDSLVVYVKELDIFLDNEVLRNGYDLIATDHWFLFKKSSGKVYSYKKWSSNGLESEMDMNLIQFRDSSLEVDMFEITDSIIKVF